MFGATPQRLLPRGYHVSRYLPPFARRENTRAHLCLYPAVRTSRRSSSNDKAKLYHSALSRFITAIMNILMVDSDAILEIVKQLETGDILAIRQVMSSLLHDTTCIMTDISLDVQDF